MNFSDPGMFGSGAGMFLGGMFGNSDKPYQDYYNEYTNWVNKAGNINQPYMQAGKQAIGDYQSWLQSQKDPTAFINSLMGDYSQSPYAKYLQQQSMNSAQNAASAAGLTGSTPLMQQIQQNANQISAQDMNSWLQNVLGINTQYGQGQNNLIGYGQNATNKMTDVYNQAASNLGEAKYGQSAGKNQDWWNTVGGIGLMFGGL